MKQRLILTHDAGILPPQAKPVPISPQNKALYDDMLGKLDLFSNAKMTAAIPLTQELIARAYQAACSFSDSRNFTSYLCSHTVFKAPSQAPLDVHLNELLDDSRRPRYGLVALINPAGIGSRGFANKEVLPDVKREIGRTGYSPVSLDTFKRTYMEAGDVSIFLNESVGMEKSQLVGVLEAAVFTEGREAAANLMSFLGMLGVGSESVGAGGMAGPVTGMGRLEASVGLVFRAPPQVKDLSFPQNFGKFRECLRQVKTS
ncbi:MAG: hypothetical protein ABH834_00055 [Candidatus Altiarchaeota archaeon]